MAHAYESNLELYPIWKYRATFKESDAGGGTITVNFSPGLGRRMKLISLRVTMSDTAIGIGTLFYIIDSASNVIFALAGASVSMDNNSIHFPTIGATAGTNNTPYTMDFVIAGDDAISIIANSLAQNETFTVAIRAYLIPGYGKPSVSASSTGTLGTTTTTYDSVI